MCNTYIHNAKLKQHGTYPEGACGQAGGGMGHFDLPQGQVFGWVLQYHPPVHGRENGCFQKGKLAWSAGTPGCDLICDLNTIGGKTATPPGWGVQWLNPRGTSAAQRQNYLDPALVLPWGN